MSQKPSLLLATFALLAACTQMPNREFEADLRQGRCDAALEHLNTDSHTRFLGRTERAVGTTLSYAVTGVGYGADVVLSVVEGTVVIIGFCSPAILVSMTRSGVLRTEDGKTLAPNICLPADWKSISFPHFGRDIYHSTAEWRCPDLTGQARGIRKVALCHEGTGGREGLEKANQTIRSLTANNEFMDCITETERALIRTEAFRLDQLLHRGDTP